MSSGERCGRCGAPVVLATHERTGRDELLEPAHDGPLLVYPAGDASMSPGRSMFRAALPGEAGMRYRGICPPGGEAA